MRKTGLFKRIFEKHLHKGKEPITSFVEDVGNLKGVFSFQKIDVATGNILTEQSFNNILVNQSKSTIIRLLGQGRSRYIQGDIDPSLLRISKMRFSNDIGNGVGSGLPADKISRMIPHNKYEYYSIRENSHRISIVDDNHAGGKYSTTNRIVETNHVDYKTIHTTEKLASNSSKIVTDALGNKIIGFKVGLVNDPAAPARHPVRPPSHGSVKVEIYRAGQIIEEIYFNNKMGTKDSPERMFYNKNQDTNKPFMVVNYKQSDGKYYHVSIPTNPLSSYVEDSEKRVCYIDNLHNATNTRIFYDYFSDQIGWKLYFSQLPSNTVIPIPLQSNTVLASTLWEQIEVKFTSGLYNIINTIIPKTGINIGYGNSVIARYGNPNYQDFYRVTTPTEDNYRDSDQDFIDDYSITFSVLMNGNDGNGEANTAGRAIKYKKAFLHCENDELFSSILIPTADFEKTNGIAYVINWRILAPVN